MLAQREQTKLQPLKRQEAPISQEQIHQQDYQDQTRGDSHHQETTAKCQRSGTPTRIIQKDEESIGCQREQIAKETIYQSYRRADKTFGKGHLEYKQIDLGVQNRDSKEYL